MIRTMMPIQQQPYYLYTYIFITTSQIKKTTFLGHSVYIYIYFFKADNVDNKYHWMNSCGDSLVHKFKENNYLYKI